MPEAENRALPGSTNDSWRTWLMTGARRTPADRRRMRGANRGLKKMLLEGMTNGGERPHAWKDFSGAMIRHAVDEAMRTLPAQDNQVVKLAYFAGYSNREIAVETGLTEATVQRRLRRALGAISEHIQHGQTLVRRAMYALLLWLSGRWLLDSAPNVAQAAAVAAVTVLVIAQPAAPGPPAANGGHAAPAARATSGSSDAAVPPLSSPSTPSEKPAVPAVPAAPVPVPALPTPQVRLPVPLPSPPPPPPPIKPPI